MYCFNCGHELEEGSLFCMYCGTKLDDESESSVSVDLSKDAAQQNELASVSVQTLPKQMQSLAPPPQEYQMLVTQSQSIQTPPISTQPLQYQTPQSQWYQPPAFHTQLAQTQDNISAYQQIIAKNSEYYLPKFQNMRCGAKSQMNWASFFLSFTYASYRNMWREWLNAMKIPLIASIITQFISMLTVLSGSIFLFLLSELISCGCGIWSFVTHVFFSNSFNQHYMKHVENKIWKRDFSPDPSVPRAVIVLLIVTGIITIISMLIGALSVMGLGAALQ